MWCRGELAELGRASERTKQSHSSYSPWQQKHSAADDCPSTAIPRESERGGRGQSGIPNRDHRGRHGSGTVRVPSLVVRKTSERTNDQANGGRPDLVGPRSLVRVRLSRLSRLGRPCPRPSVRVHRARAPRCPRNACCDHSRRIE